MVTTIENIIYPFIIKFNVHLTNYVLVFLLVGIGVWYTIKTRFVQVRCFKEGILNVLEKDGNSNKDKNSMSSFQTLATAIASQVGSGNIVGASAAILVGGPGAIFWMWLIAFFGMATIYAEANLAVKTRQIEENGNIKGGPVYYIKVAFKGKLGDFFATFFSIAAILVFGCMGCMVLSNSIGNSMESAFNINSLIVGFIQVFLCGVIFLGGVRRLASVTEKLTPIMAILFLCGAFIVLIARHNYIIETFGLIFRYAFEPQAILGGGFWYAIKTAISQGAKRGLFSNEAGMGSTPHIHALTRTRTPHEQGTIAMIGVFFDTFVVLTLTSLVVISTLYTSDGILANGYRGTITETINQINLVQVAFGTIMGSKLGALFVAICLCIFTFSTILCWNLYGQMNTSYLFRKSNSKKPIHIYLLISFCFIILGSVVSSNLVWELNDIFNSLLVIPNALALLALTNKVIKKD